MTPALNGQSIQMEVTNRGGKRSIGLDFTTEGGRELLYRLVESADVFVTSLLPRTRAKFKVDVEDIRKINPNIIYAYGHGVGTEGPEANRGAYDMTAYWCRGGFAHSLTEEDFPRPVKMRGAIGDKFGAMNLMGGIAAALFKRERTGVPSEVEVTLLGTAVWQLSSDLTYSAALGADLTRMPRGRNPLSGYYETSDGRWIALSLLEIDRLWPGFAAVAGVENLIDDPRFKDSAAQNENYEECLAVITELFKSRTLEEWKERLKDFTAPWGVVQNPLEVVNDPQVVANEYVKYIPTNTGQEIPVVPAPIRFDRKLGRLDPCPEAGEHTEEILLEIGEDWDQIIKHKEAGYLQ
jgi:crotonobetainyl-CoA:carnitine CoA-transferase CaiB-like acyl-CoA transferase